MAPEPLPQLLTVLLEEGRELFEATAPQSPLWDARGLLYSLLMELELLLLEDRPAPRRVLQVMRRLAEVSAANTETWRRYSPQPQWVAYQRFVALTRQCLVQLLVLPEPAGAPSRA